VVFPKQARLWGILGCLLLSQTVLAQEPVVLLSPRGEVSLPIVLIEGQSYVALTPLVERTGLELEWDPVLRRLVLLRNGQERVVALEGTPLYQVNGRLVQGREAPRFFERALYLPLEALREQLAPALELSFVAATTPTETPRPTATLPPVTLPPGTLPPPTPLPATPPAGATPSGEVLPVPTLPLRFAMPEDLYHPPLILSEPLAVATPAEGEVVVVLDPAGGRAEAERTSPAGLDEGEWTYELAALLKRRLEESLSVTVVLTRERLPEHPVSAEERAMRANSAGGDLLLSFRLGAGFSERSEGFSLFYMSELIDDREPVRFDAQGRPRDSWAQAARYDWDMAYLPHILESSQLAKTLRKSLDRELRSPDRGLRPARLTLLRSVQMPAVWLELGVPTNRRDAERLQDPEYRQRIVEALYLGLREYLEGIPAPAGSAASFGSGGQP